MKYTRTEKYHKNKLYEYIEALTGDANTRYSMDLMVAGKDLKESDVKFSGELAKITSDIIDLRKLSESIATTEEKRTYTININVASNSISYAISGK
ncbi:hypothetical protein M1439_02770 [Candidatus Marsarchaeota archaeon]|jgi:predicted  nucleic acid-binding Zn-ribbon protein|nr:hypothetical protein [Candidatus Marsarchaeota archaeon]